MVFLIRIPVWHFHDLIPYDIEKLHKLNSLHVLFESSLDEHE